MWWRVLGVSACSLPTTELHHVDVMRVKWMGRKLSANMYAQVMHDAGRGAGMRMHGRERHGGELAGHRAARAQGAGRKGAARHRHRLNYQ